MALDPAASADPGRRHGRNLLSLFGSQAFTWLLILVWTFVVPRRLGPSSWGILVTASAVGGLLAVLMGQGIRSYLVREMVRTPQRADHLLAATLAFRLALFVPGFVLLGLSLFLLGFSRLQALVIVLGSLAAFLTLLVEPLQAVFQAVERMEFLAAGTTVDKVSQAGGAIILVLLGFGVVAVSVEWLGATLLVLALNLLWVRRFRRLTLHTNLTEVRSAVANSLPFWTMGLFLTFYVWIDTAMLSVMTPETVVGWYGVATRLFGTLLVAATIISTAWLPRQVTAHQLGPERLRIVTRTPAEQIMVISFPIAFGAAVVAGPLIGGLYGPAYAAAVPVMIILASCVLPLYVNIVASQFLVAAGRQVVWTKVMIGASIFNPLLNLAAIPFFQSHWGNGAIGAAISLLATEVLIALVSLVLILPGVFSRGSVSRIGRAFLAAAVMTGLVWLVHRSGLLIEVAVGIISFGSLAVLMRLPTPGELSAARGLLARLRVRFSP